VELQTGISKGMAGYFVLQYEIDNYCIAAEKAIAEFQVNRNVFIDEKEDFCSSVLHRK